MSDDQHRPMAQHWRTIQEQQPELADALESLAGLTDTPEGSAALLDLIADEALHGTPGQAADPARAQQLRDKLVQHDGDQARALLDQVAEDVESLDGPLASSAADVVAQVRLALGSLDAGDPPAATLDDVRAAVQAGEPCDRLFEVRNAMAPKDPDRRAAGELLQSVGCWSPASTRQTT
jgi:hypothetical protein